MRFIFDLRLKNFRKFINFEENGNFTVIILWSMNDNGIFLIKNENRVHCFGRCSTGALIS